MSSPKLKAYLCTCTSYMKKWKRSNYDGHEVALLKESIFTFNKCNKKRTYMHITYTYAQNMTQNLAKNSPGIHIYTQTHLICFNLCGVFFLQLSDWFFFIIIIFYIGVLCQNRLLLGIILYLDETQKWLCRLKNVTRSPLTLILVSSQQN